MKWIATTRGVNIPLDQYEVIEKIFEEWEKIVKTPDT